MKKELVQCSSECKLTRSCSWFSWTLLLLSYYSSFTHCMYQSYLRLIISRFLSHHLLLVYKLYSSLFLFWNQQYLRKYSSLHNVSNSSSLLLKFTKYVSSAAKNVSTKCFDTEKQHSRAQASILKLFVLINQWNVLIFT